MSVLALILLCLAQQPAAAPLAQGLQRVEQLALGGQKAEALAQAQQLLAGRGARECAAIEYARGVVHAGASEREPAAAAFQRTRADGAGELRLAAMYNLGSLALEQAEEWFKKLPEVSGKPAAAQPQGQPPGPDALQEAKQGYLAARERFVERLRAQWNDADTRADVELVQRRLKRLEEIEKQRKEEQQKQQQKQDSKNDKPQQDKQDPKDKQDPDKPKDDPKDKDKEKQDPQQQPDPKDKDKQDPQKPEPPKPEDKPQQGDQPPPQPKDEQQKQLSKEELTRLLDKLQQLEEQAAKLRAQIHKARRVAVKKDW